MGGSHSEPARADVEAGQSVRQNRKKIDGLSRLMYAKADHQKIVATKGWDKHDENMKNTQMLKGLFKQLDPTIMKMTNDVRGEIQLSFKYDFKRSLLLIKVIKCRELHGRDIRSRMPDPYVRLIAMPDINEIGEKKTHVEKQTNEPRYDEIFAIPLEEIELVDMKLVIDVLDDDLMGHDDNLGQVIVELNTFKFKDNPIHTAWYTLSAETDFGVTGELEVSVAYQLPQRLVVTVHRATGLPARDDGRKADTFVKMHIPGTGTYHQTQTVRQSLDPEWQESFEFSVAQEELRQRQLILHAIDEDKSSRNDSLGQVIIDLCDLDPERGLWDSYKLADLRLHKGTRNIVTQHRLLEEFRQSLQAHAMSKNPSLLYGPHTGKKIKDTTDSLNAVSYVDLHLQYDNNGTLSTRIYDKCDNFNFQIVKFPYLYSNIPISPAYEVYISQLIGYSRASSDYNDFLQCCQVLTEKLLRQGYVKPRLVRAFKKCYGRHHALMKHYNRTICQIIMDTMSFGDVYTF